jgi:hypothetical protein
MDLSFGDKVSKAIDQLPIFAAELIKKHEKEIVALEKERLLSGKLIDGTRTKEYKSKPYVKYFKQGARSLPYRNYFRKGDFFDGLAVEHAEETKVHFVDYDAKSNFLEESENNKLLGLSKENEDEVSGIISKELVNIVGNELGN